MTPQEPADALLTADSLDETDAAVLEASLSYLLDHRHSFTAGASREAPALIVDPWSLDDVLISPSQIRTGLDEDQWGDVSSFVDQLRFRNAEAIEIDSLITGSSLVRVEKLQVPNDFPDPWGRFEETYPDVMGFVKLSLPSYDDDRMAAVVMFIFGPTAHGACGIFYLTATRDRWAVIWMDTFYMM